MDFFSKLGKKASETYQVTKENVSNLTEELKIKGKINESKDKIEGLYLEIGKKVYQEIKENRDVVREEIADKIEEITTLKEKIEKAELEILALKKLKKCINCGEAIDINDGFCSNCGKRQSIPQQKVEIQEEENIEAKEAEVVEVKDIENVEQKKEEE